MPHNIWPKIEKFWPQCTFGATLFSIAESLYCVKYGSSINTSKILSKILSNENKKTGVSRKIVCFGILIHVLSWRQQKHQCLCFHYWDFLTNFWRNNWRFIFDVVERLCYYLILYPHNFDESYEDKFRLFLIIGQSCM